MAHFTIATRKSTLAVIQSEMIADALSVVGAESTALLPLSTKGDEQKQQPLKTLGGKGLFTKEIERALLDGSANLAMHSLKDMPVEQPEGLMIGAVLPRANAADMLISHKALSTLDDLPVNATIGTSSPRRVAQILQLRPDITIAPFRGNVPTRLQKVENGKVDATILAAAGLERLNIQPKYGLLLNTLPAVGQAIIAIQCRIEDDITRTWLNRINHSPSWHKMLAERAFLAALGGDCQSPLAAHSYIEGDRLTLKAQILSLDGQTHHTAEQSGTLAAAEAIGGEVAQTLKPYTETLWQNCS